MDEMFGAADPKADEQATSPVGDATPAEAQLDEEWYLSAYPMARREIDNFHAWNATEHYRKIGRFRGYIPYRDARRPDNPAAPPSRFGGMWTDAGNALDLLRGKHEIGLVNDTQAELLEKWIRDGYVIIEKAVPDEILEPALAALEAAYSGGVPELSFECFREGERFSNYRPYHRDDPAKALDLHWLSPETRNAIFAPRIVDFLQSVFERRPMASQTLGFWRGSQQGSHQDSAYVSYSLNMHFAASWIAYEDVTPGAGELMFYPGSQKLPEYLYPGENKNIVDAMRLIPGVPLDGPIAEHVSALPGRSAAAGLQEKTFIGKAGDVLLWSADLAHGGKPISNAVTRKSMVTHYCPQELTPNYFELRNTEMRVHKDVYPYSTSVY